MARKRVDPVRDLKILQTKLNMKTKSFDAAVKQLELGAVFAGREQYLRNLTGVGVEDTPVLQNVSWVNPRYDEVACGLMVGHFRDSKTPKKDRTFWNALVPDGMKEIRDELNKSGYPFSVELLLSDEINLTAGEDEPLFGGDDSQVAPESLKDLGVRQRGERAFLRFCTIRELMLELWPLVKDFYHRGPGAPAPNEGLTFGVHGGGSMRQTDAYRRWSAAGQPGNE